MKFEFSRAWCIKMARLDTGESVSAGPLALDPDPKSVLAMLSSLELERPNIVFGRFINLLRRNKKLSREALAEKVDIDISELFEIETDNNYSPEPRSVYQLAKFFDLPKNLLMQISGLTTQRNAYVMDAAVRFAARSDTSTELSPEEKAALEAFIAVLNDQKIR